MKNLAILGSTGSIGRQCLSVVEALPGRFGVLALAAGSNLAELVGQVGRYKPEVVSVGDATKADELAERLREKGISPLPSIHHGREGMLAAGTHPSADLVVSAAVGVVGLEATYEAVKLGRLWHYDIKPLCFPQRRLARDGSVGARQKYEYRHRRRGAGRIDLRSRRRIIGRYFRIIGRRIGDRGGVTAAACRAV